MRRPGPFHGGLVRGSNRREEPTKHPIINAARHDAFELGGKARLEWMIRALFPGLAAAPQPPIDPSNPDPKEDPMSSQPSLTPYRMSANRTFWLVLAVVLVADVLDLMDSTLTTIAAPTIAAHLGGGELLIKWLGSAYSLAMGVLLVIGGRLGDKYGHRRVFLIGIAGFTLASLVCGFAANAGRSW